MRPSSDGTRRRPRHTWRNVAGWSMAAHTRWAGASRSVSILTVCGLIVTASKLRAIARLPILAFADRSERLMPSATRRLLPSKLPRQRRSRATRARLLEAAARVFAERGYAGGTTNHIAAEAGLSVGSLYQYFPNKDAMLAELMRAHVAEGAEAVVARFGDPAPEGGSVADALRPFVDAAIDAHRGDPDLHRVLFEEAPRPPDVLAELHELEDAAVAVAATLLQRSPAVRVRDPDLAAWFVVAAIESLTHRYIGSHRGALDLDAFGAELVRLLTAYLEAPAP